MVEVISENQLTTKISFKKIIPGYKHRPSCIAQHE